MPLDEIGFIVRLAKDWANPFRKDAIPMTTSYFVNGEWISREQRNSGGIGRPAKGGYPMWSDALGVHPGQIKEAQADAAKHGVSIEFHPKTGQARLTDIPHRSKYMKVRKMFDRDAGYRDMPS